MIDLKWIENKVTGEKRLYSRTLLWRVDAGGAINVMPVEWGPWMEVNTYISEKVMSEADDRGDMVHEARRDKRLDRIAELEALVRELANELESEIVARYCDPRDGKLMHPSYEWRMQRDMEPVVRARKAMREGDQR